MNLSQALTTFRKFCRDSKNINRLGVTLPKDPYFCLDEDIFKTRLEETFADVIKLSPQEAIQLH